MKFLKRRKIDDQLTDFQKKIIATTIGYFELSRQGITVMTVQKFNNFEYF